MDETKDTTELTESAEAEGTESAEAEDVESAETEMIDGEDEKKGSRKKRPLSTVKIVICLSMLFVVTFLAAGVFWALWTWDTISTDELLWHLHGSLDGANTDMVVEFVLVTVGSAALVTGAGFYALRKLRFNERQHRITYRIIQGLTGALLLAAFLSAWFGFGIGTYIRYQNTTSTYIEENYVDPSSVTLKFPEKKRNLVVIYMESMEVTFADRASGGAFPENVIEDLTVLARNNECFSGNRNVLNGGIAMPGAVWTMGALFGTTSGLPLKTPLGQNGMGKNADFFPGVTTLGDILEKEGYRNRLLMGSDANFGGCRKYYESHGNFEIHDYEFARIVGRIPEDYKVWWGYEDSKLFEYAREELSDLGADGTPFQMVIQTMDTHFEDGHLCPECRAHFGDNRYANVMDCSSRQVCELVKWIQEQDFYENTTIIITGDHPTMDKDFCEDVPDSYLRKTYTCVINGAAENQQAGKDRVYTTYDLFPTTLAALGVEIEGDRLGLGTSLYSKEPTLTEKDELTVVEEEISSRSELMEKMFWNEYEHPARKEKSTDEADTGEGSGSEEQTEEDEK